MNRAASENPLGLGLVIVGALAMAIAVFLPLDEPTSRLSTVRDNTLIQSGGWLLIALAVGIAASGYRVSQGRRGERWVPTILCVIAAALITLDANDKGLRTLYPVLPDGTIDTRQPGTVVTLGVAIYVAGAGVAVASMGSLILRQSAKQRVPDPLVAARAEAATKKCPDCAETVLADAKVCKHCGYRFPAAAVAPAQQVVPTGPSGFVRCYKCNHSQDVPLSRRTFRCARCNTTLERKKPTLAANDWRDLVQRPTQLASTEPTRGPEAAPARRAKRPSGLRLSRHTTAALAAAAVVLIAAIVAIVAIATYYRPSQRSYAPQAALPLADMGFVAGVAVDNAGTVYVAHHGTNSGIRAHVLKLPAGASTPIVLPLNLNLPTFTGVAVDTAGDVYVTDNSLPSRVVKLPQGASTPTVLPFTELNQPEGVAVDNAGDVYVADGGDPSRVLKLPPGANTETALPFTGLEHPRGVAVDAAGDVYVTDTDNNRVIKLAAGSSDQAVLPFEGLKDPEGVAVDNAGAVYVVDTGNHRVVELAAGATAQTMLPFSGLSYPAGVAVDGAGYVYASNSQNGNGQVLKLLAQ